MGDSPTVQSNLYTVGLMAYLMLTGRYCLSTELPSEIMGEIDPDWDEWISKALAYNPEDRFVAASEMLQSMPGLEFGEGDGIVETETKAAS